MKTYIQRKTEVTTFLEMQTRKYSATVVELAKVELVFHGFLATQRKGFIDKLRAKYEHSTKPNAIMTCEYRNTVLDCASEIVAWLKCDQRTIWEMQVLCSPTTDDELVDGDTCPICHTALQFNGDQEIVDDGTTASWCCPGCGASGVQCNDIVFNTHIGVSDADGKSIDLSPEE